VRGTRLVVGMAIAAHVVSPAPARSVQVTIGGRPVDLDTTLSIREVIEENGSVKHERTLEQLRVRAAVSLTDWLRFDSTTVGTNGGPTLKADRAGVYTCNDVFQDVSPALEFDEAYLDMFLPSLDLRLGKQKIAWGKLDRFQPNDLINPLTYSDPILQEEGERKIGVPALQASYYLPRVFEALTESRLTAVWVTKYLPYRLPLASCDLQGNVSHCDVERWFPPAAVPPSAFTVPLPGTGPVQSVTVPIAFHTRNAAPPAWRIENGEIGLRYSGLLHDVDFAFYYFHGFDPFPAFLLTADALGQPDPTPGNPLHLKNVSGDTVLSPEFRQIDSWGADGAYAFDQFTVRAEGAYIRGRPFPRDLRMLISDPALLLPELLRAFDQLAHGAGRVPVALPPSFVVRDAVEWGVGADYLYEGYLLLLQLNQTDVLHNDVDLLIKNVETRLLANLRKTFLSESLQTQLVAGHAIESDYSFLRGRALYQFTDHIAAEIGYLFIAGRSNSLVGQYGRNDEGWIRLEYKL
jgi:uncharacterized protein DUF1302